MSTSSSNSSEPKIVKAKYHNPERPMFLYNGHLPLHPEAIEMHQEWHTFETRPDDVWVATYHKAGTTWMQEILMRMLYRESNSSLVSDTQLWKRSLFFEMFDSMKKVGSQPSPRVIKTHLTYEELKPISKDSKVRRGLFEDFG